MAGHSKPGCKPKDKAKEAAVKTKGQKSEDSNSEGKKVQKGSFTIGIFWLLAFGLFCSLFGLILGAELAMASNLLQDQPPIFGSRMFCFCSQVLNLRAQPASLITLLLGVTHKLRWQYFANYWSPTYPLLTAFITVSIPPTYIVLSCQHS